MPSHEMGINSAQSHQRLNDSDIPEIRVKTAYNGQVFITYIDHSITFPLLMTEMKDICGFAQDQDLTVKWVDEEGDPCVIQSQTELDEAIRLYEVNKDAEFAVHVFPGVPPSPGQPCYGEDRSIYRRGARRWRKLYKVNGHIFQAKRFNRKAFCAYCHDRIWGLGRQGFKCIQCKLLIHKKCHKLWRVQCDASQVAVIQGRGHNSSQSVTPEQSLNPVPDISLTAEPILVTGAGGGGGASGKDKSNMVSLSDFDMIKVIGRGSYAKVLMVELKSTKRIYAMKVIKKELVTDDEDIDWVQTEKHVFETASNHPFLVGLHSCFQTPSRLFFVIEFVRGGDLMFHMQRQRRLPEEHARFYSAEICLALNYLHERGIIYRDLKLDNVLLDHEGHIKLTDYGMCKEGIRQGDTTSTFCGTPNYIAPEILRAEDYGFSVDWWALGVLLYEMLAGRSPFDIVGATDNPDQNTEDYLFQVILEKTIRIPRSLSVKAASILKGFLNKNPADRLGCNRESGFVEIMTHAFFKTIDWGLLEQKQIPPPYRPRLESERDLANFPPEFTDEPVQLTPDDPSIIGKIDQTEFDGFETMYALHTRREAAHNDSIWCCDWKQVRHVKEDETEEVEDIIVTGGVDDVVKIWNYKDGELQFKHQLTDHSLGVVSVALSSDGRRVASSSLDSVIIVCDTLTGAKTATMETGPVDAWSVIFTSDDHHVVSGTHAGAVNLFNVETGKLEHHLDSKSKFTLSLTASKDGKHLATGAIDGIINVFDLLAKKLIHTLEGHAMPIRSLDFSPDSTKLLTGSDDGHMKLYDISNATLLGSMSGHVSWVISVSFSPDSEHLVSGSSDGCVKVWEVTSRQCVHTFKDHHDQVWGVKFNSTGDRLISVSDDKNINVYAIPV